MNRALPVLLALLVSGCTQPSSPDAPAPQVAGQPLDPVQAASRLVAMRVAAATGNQAETRRQMDALQHDVRRSMKLADPARRIDPEAARAIVRQVAGVHSVAWMDRDNLLAIVEDNELRSQKMVDTICMKLERLGDTLGVIVNLKTRSPRTGDERGTTGRNCQLAEGDVAMFQKAHATYDPPPEVTAAFRASQHLPEQEDEAAREEARRIIEATIQEI